ncbi:MAG: hypothetical protein CVV23_05085 [Ignavibacteriae bacterium HGW-Ignavibacteriae-2]|nr:MAG: hypothetical protein CVV23_05085 [Ignavibacteriae bacterium HGW-Ignavibacteriae-2]
MNSKIYTKNYITMKRLTILFYILFLISTVYAGNNSDNKPLVIFHLDLNSVSLRQDYIREWLEKAADMGYNAVLWEVEDEVIWETCPECVSPDAFTKEDFRKLLEYSKELGLEPIPLFQTIGHAEYVLDNIKYKSFREDSTRYDCYCTTNIELRNFLKKWLDEYLELFGDIRYFHLGGDEAYSFASCAKCKARAESIGENQLYAEHINDLSQSLIEKGIRPGIWCDMILKHPKEINVIDKNFVIWDWNYWDGDSTPENVLVWSEGKKIGINNISESILSDFPEIIDDKGNLKAFYTSDMLRRLGYDVILCSSSRSHGDGVFIGRNDLHADNIIGAARKVADNNLLGNCVTSWAVRVHNYETQELWLILAPLTIKYPSLKKNDLLLKASEKMLGISSLEFFEAINQIGYSFPFANEKSTGIMWTGMKDSKPAPKNYIKEMIDKWKKNNSGKQWDFVTKRVMNSTDTIVSGITTIHTLIPKTILGTKLLNNISRAGYFQYWQSIIANSIIHKTEGKNRIQDSEIIAIIRSLKREYTLWAEEWMTHKSAEINSSLIYDAIENYFKSN